MQVELIAHTNNILNVMYTSARTCYSEKSPIQLSVDASVITNDEKFKFISKILKSGHTSIAEHVTFTFAIEGISRACSHQLVRHRHCTFSQQSQRYVDFSDCDFIVPDGLIKKAYIMIGEALAVNKSVYQRLIDLEVKKEDARCILPNCIATNIVMTCNLRELMHMCNLRLCTRAQKEIRDLFREIKKEVIKVEPRLKDLLVPSCESLGFCPEEKSCGKFYKKVFTK